MRYLISLLGLVAIVGSGYFAVAQYINIAHGQSAGSLVADAALDVSADGAQVLALLGRLKAITLSDKIFSNPNFLTLQDWSVEIAPQMVGRQNPYLPASGIVPAVASTTRVALPRSDR